MKRMMFLASLVLFGATLWAAPPGIHPRAKAEDYSASAHNADFAIGAKQLSKSEVRDAFMPDQIQDYLVIEVAVFPSAGSSINIKRDQFTLLTPDKAVTRPLTPEQITKVVAEGNGWDHTATHSSVGIGVASGHGTDIATGTTGGVSTSAETMTTIGSRPYSIERVRKELERKMLREGKLDRPVAGYLLFRRPLGGPSNCELRFQGDRHAISLVVPPAK